MIDLGEVTDAAPEQVVPVDHRRIRRAVLAVATIAGLLLVAGSARPAPPFGLHPLWSTPITVGNSPAFEPGAGYVLRGTELTAYDLASGAVRWTAPADDVLYGAEPAGDVVLLRTGRVTVERKEPDGTGYSFEFARSTVALAASTGAVLWRAGGEPYVKHGGIALFEERNERGDTVRIRLIRLTDGTTIWTRAVPGAWTVTQETGDHPGPIITLDPGGEVNVFRYADGALVHRGRLPGTAGRSPAGGGVQLAGMDGLLAVVPAQPNGTTDFYRLTDLTRLWQRADSGSGIRPCGPVLCVVGQHAVTGHDPATGRELWRQPGMQWVWPAGPGRLLLSDDDFTHQLTDAATGRPIGPPALGQRLVASAPGESLLLLRNTTRPAGLTSVTRLNLTTGAQTVLGVIDPDFGPDSCWNDPRYLACINDGVLTVRAIGWR